MRTALVTGVAVGFLTGMAAQASASNLNRPFSGSGSSAERSTLGLTYIASTHPEPSRFKSGMVVKDRQGARVAVILRTDQTKDGHPAFLVDDNGAQFTILASKFKLNRKGNEAIVSLTRSQIRTSAILNTG